MASTTYDKEKSVQVHLENSSMGPPSSGSVSDKERDASATEEDIFDDIDAGFDPAEVKRTVRKVDMHIIPVLGLMYCVSLIDRTNLSIARASNQKAMNKDLGLNVGDRYSIATMIFFIPYIVLELPSQLGLRRFGVRIWLGGATFLWGIVMMCAGFIHTWQQLVAIRALLGIFESVLFPGAAYLISCWYPRKSMALRNTLFYYTATAVGAVSTIMGWGLGQMHGIANLNGWRWIFIIEGLITVVVGVLALFFLQEFPDRCTFLDDRQKHIIKTRIQRDRGDAVHDPVTMAKIGEYCLDLKTWAFSLIFFSATLASYALAYFLPTILQEMGFNNMESQLLFAPPKAWGIIPGVVIAWLCDKYKQRAYGCIANSALLILGTCMFSKLPKSALAARYIGVFLACGGATGNVPLTVAWAQTSIRAQSKRAFTSAVIVAWGGVGGICAGVLFMEKEAKKGYPTGIYSTIAFNAFAILLALALKFYFHHQNRKADRGEIILEHHPLFRYQG